MVVVLYVKLYVHMYLVFVSDLFVALQYSKAYCKRRKAGRGTGNEATLNMLAILGDIYEAGICTIVISMNGAFQ